MNTNLNNHVGSRFYNVHLTSWRKTKVFENCIDKIQTNIFSDTKTENCYVYQDKKYI